MKNKEKYFDEILKAFINQGGGDDVCQFKIKHILKLKTCGGVHCNRCEQYTREWLEQEYKEPIVLSEDEKAILKIVGKQYEWIARNKDGYIHAYYDKPTKWVTSGNWVNMRGYSSLSIFKHLFQFVKWEDTEPYSIEDLLKQNGVER